MKRERIFSFLKDDFLLHSLIVFLAHVLVGAFSFLYQIIAVRILPIEDYGTFNALVSAMMLIVIAMTPLCMTLTHFFTKYITRKDFQMLDMVFKGVVKRMGVATGVLFLLILTIAPHLAVFLKANIWHIFIAAVAVVISLFYSPFIAVLFSFKKFKVHSVLWSFSALVKLFFGALLMFYGLGIVGGLAGFLVEPILILAIVFFFVRKMINSYVMASPRKENVKVDFMPIYRFFFPVCSAMVTFTIISNADVVMVKHLFSPLDAGYYSTAQMVTKIAFLLPSAIALVIFPKSTEAVVNNNSPKKILYKALGMAAICCCFIIALSNLFPDFIVKLLTGKTNTRISSLVGVFSIAMSFYAFLWITINYSLAIHKLKFVFPLCCIAVSEIILINRYHSSLTMVLSLFLIFAVIAFLTVLVMALSRGKKVFGEKEMFNEQVFDAVM